MKKHKQIDPVGHDVNYLLRIYFYELVDVAKEELWMKLHHQMVDELVRKVFKKD